ncbi:MAG: DUF1722 domain-containing protein [Candidatus Altiarchaeota archaeon]|nr:DUF1722 domain-containing protein [Candidatus Altiarchaeota archaeon]
MTEPEPNVVVSKCLGFEACRYNGQIIEDRFVKKLEEYVNYIPVCAEVEIGLGVPRDPIRVIQSGGERKLMQPNTGRDVSKEMDDFSERFLSSLKNVDGFILKNRSPSCGIKDVRIYSGMGRGENIGKGAGFFGGRVLERFLGLAVEDEGRLKDYRIREHFLTKLYTLARFRQVKNKRELQDFHARNKYLLTAYNQEEMRILGRIAANPGEDSLERYREHLGKALYRAPSCKSNINVLMHVFGYFKDKLSPGEKAFFHETLDRYRNRRASIGSLQSVLSSWTIRFGEDYLEEQTFFNPYPGDLIKLVDECICKDET